MAEHNVQIRWCDESGEWQEQNVHNGLTVGGRSTLVENMRLGNSVICYGTGSYSSSMKIVKGTNNLWINGWALGSGGAVDSDASMSGMLCYQRGTRSHDLYLKGYTYVHGPFLWYYNASGTLNDPLVTGVTDGNAKNTNETVSSPMWGGPTTSGYTKTMSIDTASGRIVYSWFLDTSYAYTGSFTQAALTLYDHNYPTSIAMFALLDLPETVVKTAASKVLFNWTVSF